MCKCKCKKCVNINIWLFKMINKVITKYLYYLLLAILGLAGLIFFSILMVQLIYLLT